MYETITYGKVQYWQNGELAICLTVEIEICKLFI